MKKISYELEILGEKKKYLPRKEFVNPICQSANRIFEITGDNSYGKTFLLNLLAYGLEVDKLGDDKVLKTIKKRVESYDDRSAYKLQYDIELSLPNGDLLKLSKEDGNARLIRINDSAPIGASSLHKNLSIIYDVPTNPSERLNAVITDLESWHKNVLSKNAKLLTMMDKVTRKFDSIRDEKQIGILQESLKSLEQDRENNNLKINEKVKIKENIKLIQELKDLENTSQKVLKERLKEQKLSKRLKSLPKPSKSLKKNDQMIDDLTGQLFKIERDYKKIILQLIDFINSHSEISDYLNDNLSLSREYDSLKNTEFTGITSSDDIISASNSFKESINNLKSHLLSFIDEKTKGESYRIHNSYKNFIDALEKLMTENIDHILKKTASIEPNKLKTHLQSILEEYTIKNYDSLKQYLKGDFIRSIQLLGLYTRTNIQLEKEKRKTSKVSDDDRYEKTNIELKMCKKLLKELIDKETSLRVTCAKELGIERLDLLDNIQQIAEIKKQREKKYSNYFSQDGLINSLKRIEREINTLKEKDISLRGRMKFNQTALDREEGKESSLYNNTEQEKIKNFLQTLRMVNQNLHAYSSVIQKIHSEDSLNFNHDNDKQFITLAGRIIAYSMDNKLLRADGEYLRLNFYDSYKQEFHCENDIIIKKDDVSTGLASANYLKQRIDNVDGEFVVVLLDEIGNMAQTAIDKVIESLKNLEQQNRLVLALFTKPNSKEIKILEY